MNELVKFFEIFRTFKKKKMNENKTGQIGNGNPIERARRENWEKESQEFSRKMKTLNDFGVESSERIQNTLGKQTTPSMESKVGDRKIKEFQALTREISEEINLFKEKPLSDKEVNSRIVKYLDRKIAEAQAANDEIGMAALLQIKKENVQ